MTQTALKKIKELLEAFDAGIAKSMGTTIISNVAPGRGMKPKKVTIDERKDIYPKGYTPKSQRKPSGFLSRILGGK